MPSSSVRNPHPYSTAHNIGTSSKPPSRRASWRHKDSSEKTPSTVESDDATYIAPGIPVSSLPLGSVPLPMEEGDVYAHINNTAGRTPSVNSQRSVSLASAASGTTDPLGLEQVLPWVYDDDTCTARVGGNAEPSASIISPPLRVLVNRRQQQLSQAQEHDVPASQLGSTTVLAPLKPQYSPPKRRPTPPGVPSFDSTQRTLEARLALRRYGANQPRRNVGTVRTSSSGTGNRAFSGLSL